MLGGHSLAHRKTNGDRSNSKSIAFESSGERRQSRISINEINPESFVNHLESEKKKLFQFAKYASESWQTNEADIDVARMI